MESRDTCIFYRSIYEAVKELPKETQAEIYNAIFNYSLNFVQPQLSGMARTVWILIEPVLTKGNVNYINGKQPKQKRNGSEQEANPKRSGSEPEAYKDKDKDKDKEKDNDKEKKGKDKPFVFDSIKKVEAENFIPQSEKLNKAFQDFLISRIAKKKPATQKAVENLLHKLKVIYKSEHEALEGINKAITNAWTDLYPLNDTQHQQAPKSALEGIKMLNGKYN